MRATTAISLWIVRIAGVVQILLGILLWVGRYNYRSVHMVIGILIVVALWVIASIALVARVRSGLAAFALVWGAALAAFGMRQGVLMIGEQHWIIRVTHLFMGLAALGIAAQLGRAILAVSRSERVEIYARE